MTASVEDANSVLHHPEVEGTPLDRADSEAKERVYDAIQALASQHCETRLSAAELAQRIHLDTGVDMGESTVRRHVAALIKEHRVSRATKRREYNDDLKRAVWASNRTTVVTQQTRKTAKSIQREAATIVDKLKYKQLRSEPNSREEKAWATGLPTIPDRSLTISEMLALQPRKGRTAKPA